MALRQLCIIAIVIATLGSLPACFIGSPSPKDPGPSGPRGNGEGVYGVGPSANFGNARVQCGFESLTGSREHEINCKVTVVNALGVTEAAGQIEAGTQLTWRAPQGIDGTDIQSYSCQVHETGLSQKCQVTLDTTNTAKVEMALKITEEAKERQETAVLLIPFSVVSFGSIPEIPFQLRTKSEGLDASAEDEGFEAVQMDPLKTSFPEPLSGCVRGTDEIFFTSRNFVYRLKGGKAELFAGSANEIKANALSQRRRFNFGPSLWVACAQGALYVGDTQNHRIYRVPDAGPVTVVAGTGVVGFSGDDGPAPLARLSSPAAMVISPKNEIIFSDSDGTRIRKIDVTGKISTIAGNGSSGSTGDGGPAAEATLTKVTGFTFSPDGGLIFADNGANAVRKIDSAGNISLIANNAFKPYGVAYGKDSVLYMTSTEQRSVYPIFAPNQPLTGFPFRLMSYPASPVGQMQKLYPVNPMTIFFDQNDALILCDFGLHLLRRYNKPTGHGNVPAIAGMEVSVNPDNTEVESGKLRFRGEGSVAMSKDGAMYVADVVGHRIVRIDRDNSVKVVGGKGAMQWSVYNGGDGFSGFTPDGQKAKDNFLFAPSALTVDDAGNVYFAESRNWRIRKISPEGTYTTVVGRGFNDYDGEGGLAINAAFRSVSAIAIGPDGSLYFSDVGTHLIRKVSPQGYISRFAGTGVWDYKPAAFWQTLFPRAGYSGDGGYATNALLSSPRGLAVAPDGTVFVADSGNNRIRRIAPNGVITTIAGKGAPGFSGDGGPATQAMLNSPTGLTLLGDGTILVADYLNKRVRALKPTTSSTGSIYYTISTIIASSETECGTGIVQRKVADDKVKEAFAQSVARQCVSHPRSIAALGQCREKGDTLTIAVYQNFGIQESFTGTISANTVRYQRPCD